jgi:hypothetical protein
MVSPARGPHITQAEYPNGTPSALRGLVSRATRLCDEPLGREAVLHDQAKPDHAF